MPTPKYLLSGRDGLHEHMTDLEGFLAGTLKPHHPSQNAPVAALLKRILPLPADLADELRKLPEGYGHISGDGWTLTRHRDEP